MTNHDSYKKAFRQVQPSQKITMEDLEMKKNAYVRGKIMAVVSGIAAAVLLSGGVCYAANVGGIQDAVKLWIHGSQVDATVEIAEDVDGSYMVSYVNDAGEMESFLGGGFEEGENGEMVPVSMEDYVDYLNSEIEFEKTEDGHMYLNYQDQHIDITDQFTICETKLEINGEPTWVRVDLNSDGSYQLHTSADPWEFSEEAEPDFEEPEAGE